MHGACRFSFWLETQARLANILPDGGDAVIMADQLKKTLGLETVEPALTPPPAEQEPAIQKNPVRPGTTRKREIPQGLWTKCPECEEMIFDKELEENLKVCPHCTHHFPTTAHRADCLANGARII